MKKIQYQYCTVPCTVSRDDRTIKNMLFHQSAAQAMKKRVIGTHFPMKIVCMYVYITCNKKIVFVKSILAYCGYSLTSPFFLLLSEHKHCDNVATNSKSENARSRMVASLQGSMGTGAKEDESNTGHVWAAGFHHVTARSRLVHISKLMNCLFI
jgi:hypothetical protein